MKNWMDSVVNAAEPQELPAGGTSVLERTETEREKAPGDGERYAHYVRNDKITASAVTGQAVVALCGKVWVPLRDPKNYPVCPICKQILKDMQSNSQGNGWPFVGDS